MGIETGRSIFVSPVLQRGIGALANAPGRYIGTQVVEGFSTGGQRTGTVVIHPAATFFGDASISLRREPNAAAKRSTGVGEETAEYSCDEYSLDAAIDIRTLRNAQAPLARDNKRLAEMAKVWETQQIKRELRDVAAIFDAATWNTTALGAAVRWSTAGGMPLQDIADMLTRVENWGLPANTIVFGRAPAENLKQNSNWLEFLPVGQDTGIATNAEVRSRLTEKFPDLQRVHFGLGRYNTANPGLAAVMANLWGNFVWAGHIGDEGMMIGDQYQANPTAIVRPVEAELAFESDEFENTGRVEVYPSNVAETLRTVNEELGELLSTVT